MLNQKPTHWNRLRRLRGIRHLASFAAGIHTANGLAHGVQPPAMSLTREQRPNRT